MYLVIDIETVAGPRIDEFVRDREYKPDSTLSPIDCPPKSITDLKSQELREARLAEWTQSQKLKLETSALEARQKDIDKAGLYWWTGKAVCISIIDISTDEQHTIRGDDEASLLTWLLGFLSTRQSHTLIGKSSQDFDIPFLAGRCMAHDLGLTAHLRMGRYPTTDVDRFFGVSKGSGQTSSLSNYAFGLGLPGKLCTGNKVQSMYNAAILGCEQSWEDIAAYCERDTMITAELVRRYIKTYIPEETPQDVEF